MNWEGYEVEGQMDISEFLDDKGENMTENEAIKVMESYSEEEYGKGLVAESHKIAIQSLSEIQQYRAYKEIFESHFSKDALELLSDKEEFGKWLERGKWIAKKCDEINRKLESFEAIGTIEEFKALKEKNEPKKPIIHGLGQRYCPVCKCGGADHFYCARYCARCGQKLG